jgi:hypothetical protein
MGLKSPKYQYYQISIRVLNYYSSIFSIHLETKTNLCTKFSQRMFK